jgi:hypothetical protein
MKDRDIPFARLAVQAISRQLASPVAVVRHLLALQAQDYAGTKWAVALRVAKPIGDAALERCFDQGTILRTHALRGTWQLVLPEDARWLVVLARRRTVDARRASGRARPGTRRHDRGAPVAPLALRRALGDRGERGAPR